jgi:hypothetical protein
MKCLTHQVSTYAHPLDVFLLLLPVHLHHASGPETSRISQSPSTPRIPNLFPLATPINKFAAPKHEIKTPAPNSRAKVQDFSQVLSPDRLGTIPARQINSAIARREAGGTMG